MGRMAPRNGTQGPGRPCQRPRAWLCDEFGFVMNTVRYTAPPQLRGRQRPNHGLSDLNGIVPCPMRPSSLRCVVARGSYMGPVSCRSTGCKACLSIRIVRLNGNIPGHTIARSSSLLTTTGGCATHWVASFDRWVIVLRYFLRRRICCKANFRILSAASSLTSDCRD